MAVRRKKLDILKELVGIQTGKDNSGNDLEEMKRMAGLHRGGGQDILNELELIRCVSRTDMIGEEKLQQISRLIEGYKKVLEQAHTSVLDTTKIDENIVKMVTLLRNALEKEKEETAVLICGDIGTCIMEFRSDIRCNSKEEEQKILNKREMQTRYMLALATFRSQADELKEEILQYEAQQKAREEAYKNAYEQLEASWSEYPELENAVEEGLISRARISAVAKELNTQKGKVVSLYKNIENIKAMKAKARQRLAECEENVRNLTLQLEESAVALDEKLVDEVLALQELFEKELLEGEREIDRLREASADFQSLLDSLFTSSKELDRMIKNEIEFTKLQKELKKQEKARAEAMQRKLQETQEQESEMLSN
ncbi:MAG: hypothetical protein Q4F83_01860 [Eubacteriales bacterium]|nr:hypothetical protein [Eubacteriales bacterium]